MFRGLRRVGEIGVFMRGFSAPICCGRPAARSAAASGQAPEKRRRLDELMSVLPARRPPGRQRTLPARSVAGSDHRTLIPSISPIQTETRASSGAAPQGRGCGHRDGADVEVRAARRQAGVRVSRADGHEVRRGPAGDVGRDRHGRRGVDGPGRTDEGEARAPGPALQSSPG